MEHSTVQLRSIRSFPMRGLAGINVEGLSTFDPLMLEDLAFRQ
jgi:hypothetical protein